ncbi:SRPBCC family protein [Saccharothrix xinjiangensis]|uniref:SRPBCC family protein n=1 Tax=Saccharothrix xinjiangensis TaxID=204798 RepID=A0ABV9Y687_9PSEU
MTAAERTRSVPADAEAVFDVLTDLDQLSAWLPSGVEVERYGPDLVRLWVGEQVVERRLVVDWANLRIEWGDRAAPAYRGELRVLRIAPGRCAVAVRLVGPEGLPAPRLDDWLVEALEVLAGLVGAGDRSTLPLAGTGSATG